jgi:predicted negative regulator of RcsB-dependent stress response
MDSETTSDGWNEWSKHVLLELNRLNTLYSQLTDALQERNDAINKEIQDMRVELATLKVRASMWGALAGLVPAMVVIATFLIGN